MSWSIGYDTTWNRDIGYGVPATCDQPGCGKQINRGLSYVCGSQPCGGERGCGLYFCEDHLDMTATMGSLCDRCYPRIKRCYKPTPDVPEWIKHKLTDESWARWRRENPDEVARMSSLINKPVITET